MRQADQNCLQNKSEDRNYGSQFRVITGHNAFHFKLMIEAWRGLAGMKTILSSTVEERKFGKI